MAVFLRGASIACIVGGLAVQGAAAAADLLDKAVGVDIPTQPVATALIALSKQANVQIIMPSSSFADQQMPGLHGQMSLRAALIAMLGAGRFRSRQVGDGTITIEAIAGGAK